MSCGISNRELKVSMPNAAMTLSTYLSISNRELKVYMEILNDEYVAIYVASQIEN